MVLEADLRERVVRQEVGEMCEAMGDGMMSR